MSFLAKCPEIYANIKSKKKLDFPWRKSLDNGFYGQKWSKIEEKKGKNRYNSSFNHIIGMVLMILTLNHEQSTYMKKNGEKILIWY